MVLPADLERGAIADDGLAMLAVVDAGRVGRVRDIDREERVGLDIIDVHCAADEPDFLLHAAGGDNAALQAVPDRGEATDDFRADPRANAIIEGASDRNVAVEDFEIVDECRRVADGDFAQGFLAILRGNIDVELVNLRRVLACERGGCDDATHRALAAVDVDAFGL